MIVAGIGSRKGVSAAEVVAAVEAALAEHGLERGALARLATMTFKKEEAGIFEAGRMLGLEVLVVESPVSDLPPHELPPPLAPPHKGEGDGVALSEQTSAVVARASQEFPSPLWGGVRVGGPSTSLPTFADPRDRPEDDDAGRGGQPSLCFKLAGVVSVSEAAALAAAGEGARLAGPRTVLGKVTCAIAFGAEA